MKCFHEKLCLTGKYDDIINAATHRKTGNSGNSQGKMFLVNDSIFFQMMRTIRLSVTFCYTAQSGKNIVHQGKVREN